MATWAWKRAEPSADLRYITKAQRKGLVVLVRDQARPNMRTDQEPTWAGLALPQGDIVCEELGLGR